MVAWRDLGRQLDAEVDAQWGERLRILPWLPNNGGQDFSRPIREIVGKILLASDTIVGGGGEALRTGSFISRMAEAENAVHISAGQLDYELRGGDRIHALDRDQEYFEVSHISQSFDDGFVASLIRVPRGA